MYRVMTIDDEISVRKLLQKSIEWKLFDMEIVGEASSGIEAINIIDDIRPDIIFVDICMPFMNGIEFVKLATKRYPDLKIVVLTAFDDFEFARQCVSLPVVEYMVKPIVREEVCETLKKIKEQLDIQRPKQIEEAEDMEVSSIEQIKQYIRENFTDSQINLTSVAMQFGFSSSYLSRKFKQETGTSFVEYLIECRMQRAVELAKKKKKMFYTASEVGIPDPNYFGRCFKKYIGVSYSEFVNDKTNTNTV